MKIRNLVLLLIGTLPLMAFDCVVDQSGSDFNVTISPDPLNATYVINPGTSLTYGGSAVVPASVWFNNSDYDITSVSVFDIKVSTAGPDLGNCAGDVTVNGQVLFHYAGPWATFKAAPQSLLTSPLITGRNPAVMKALITAINSRQNVTLAVVNGTITTAAAIVGSSVNLSAYFQASGHKRGD